MAIATAPTVKGLFAGGPYEAHGFVYATQALWDGLHGPNAIGILTVCRSAALRPDQVAIRSGVRTMPGDTAPACYRHDVDLERVHGHLRKPDGTLERVRVFSFDGEMTARAFGPGGPERP